MRIERKNREIRIERKNREKKDKEE